MGCRIRHLRPGLEQRKRAKPRARREALLRRKAAIQPLQLLQIGRPGNQQYRQCHQKVAISFLSAAVRQELLQKQACWTRHRNQKAFDVEWLSRAKQRQVGKYEERQLAVFEHIGFADAFSSRSRALTAAWRSTGTAISRSLETMSVDRASGWSRFGTSEPATMTPGSRRTG
jgi:hypothetical protein